MVGLRTGRPAAELFGRHVSRRQQSPPSGVLTARSRYAIEYRHIAQSGPPFAIDMDRCRRDSAVNQALAVDILETARKLFEQLEAGIDIPGTRLAERGGQRATLDRVHRIPKQRSRQPRIPQRDHMWMPQHACSRGSQLELLYDLGIQRTLVGEELERYEAIGLEVLSQVPNG